MREIQGFFPHSKIKEYAEIVKLVKSPKDLWNHHLASKVPQLQICRFEVRMNPSQNANLNQKQRVRSGSRYLQAEYTRN